jgi:ion channel-forming bestrophin family protein
MKAYNPRHWFTLIFSFHKSDSFRMLIPAMLSLITLSGILCYIQIELKYVTFRSTTVMHSLVGFVISLLLVFRTNTAYERWWEGRKLFGDLSGNCRNLMLRLNMYIPEEQRELKNNFRVLITNYAVALRAKLGGDHTIGMLEEHPSLSLEELRNNEDVPARVLEQLYTELDVLHRKNIISEKKMISLHDEIRAFGTIGGACERIRNTPIPYSYSSFIKRMIFIYVITLPLGLISDLKWATIPIVLFVFYAFASLELIAEEIEDPFGADDNDLPISKIVEDIKKNLTGIIK